LPIAGDVEVLDGETPEAIELAIRADSQGLLTADEGEALAALTYLVNRMTNKGLRNTKRVVIEAEGLRSDHVAALEKLALDLAARVRTSGEPAQLEPMNSYERRIVHMALRGASDIRTDSDGEGPYKRVIIRPADNS
jgi:spoIIIJ-associated protein